MMQTTTMKSAVAGVALIAATALLVSTTRAQEPAATPLDDPRGAPTLRPFESLRVVPSKVEGRLAQGRPEQSRGTSGSREAKERMIALGKQHKTAADLYAALKKQAGGGKRLAYASLPDWTGLYTRARGGITYDPDQQPGQPPTAKLTPEFQARLAKRIEEANRGIEWDPISTCAPPGHPRWLTEPFLKEFIVTPDQTWLINEMVNDIRRIYTDGRDHVPAADRYPLYNGDSIGFWDGDKLVIHTNQLTEGIYQRRNPDYTNQVETVEIWQKTSDTLIEVDVWVYDPPALVEPWYTKQSYAKLDDQDKNLRIRYWHCGENQNNAVGKTDGGGSQFRGFTFGNQGGKP